MLLQVHICGYTADGTLDVTVCCQTVYRHEFLDKEAITVTRSTRVDLLQHAAHMAKRSNAYRVVAGNREVTTYLFLQDVYFFCHVLHYSISRRMLPRIQVYM
jgi:hypothetical protein